MYVTKELARDEYVLKGPGTYLIKLSYMFKDVGEREKII